MPELASASLAEITAFQTGPTTANVSILLQSWSGPAPYYYTISIQSDDGALFSVACAAQNNDQQTPDMCDIAGLYPNSTYRVTHANASWADQATRIALQAANPLGLEFRTPEEDPAPPDICSLGMQSDCWNGRARCPAACVGCYLQNIGASAFLLIHALAGAGRLEVGAPVLGRMSVVIVPSNEAIFRYMDSLGLGEAFGLTLQKSKQARTYTDLVLNTSFPTGMRHVLSRIAAVAYGRWDDGKSLWTSTIDANFSARLNTVVDALELAAGVRVAQLYQISAEKSSVTVFAINSLLLLGDDVPSPVEAYKRAQPGAVGSKSGDARGSVDNAKTLPLPQEWLRPQV